ncbi:MAG: CRISPR-associated endonuclease Cas1, partial [Alphaproteobacteria bacterium]
MLFQKILSPDTLRRAFLKVLRNGGMAGGDGESGEAFAGALEANLARLAFEIEHGLYRPGPLRRFPIEKPGGGERWLAVPCVADRVVQTAAAEVLSAFLEPQFEDSSYGYRPGRSVRQAIDRVAFLRRQGYHWVVDGDIRAFFDRVPHDLLLRKLTEITGDPDLSALVGLWLESFSETGVGLAQGSPVSPVLANLHLDALDEAFDERRTSLRLVRYADDFLLLARSREGAEKALAQVARELARAGLELNPEKTRIVRFEEALRFLGALFVRSVLIHDSDSLDAHLRTGENKPEGATAPEARGPIGEHPRADGASGNRGPLLPGPADPEAEKATPPVAAGSNGQDEPRPAEKDEYGPRRKRNNLVVMSRGARVTGKGSALAIYEDDINTLLVLPGQVAKIEIGPQAEIDSAALRLALDENVPVSFVDGYGRTRGILRRQPEGRAERVLAQARAAANPERQLDIARLLVSGRLRNAHALLKRLNRRRRDTRVEQVCGELFRLRRRVLTATDINAARGFEGRGASLYWPALSRCLAHGWKLPVRRRNPAPDPVNAVLDWTSHMLAREVSVAVLNAGLHPGIGLLHETSDRRDGLVFDLCEEFRAPVGEALTLSLFNKRMLMPDDFVERAESGVRIMPHAGRRIVTAFEDWMERVVRDPGSGERTSWRGLLTRQAQRLATALEEQSAYRPY